VYLWEKITYFSNEIIITFSNATQGITVNWCNIMLTQLGVEFTQWTKHQKNVATWNSQAIKKTSMFYACLVVDVLLCNWFLLNVEVFKVKDEFRPQHGGEASANASGI
jgi:hypothetical protein